MENMKEIYFEDEDVVYRYSVTGEGNVRGIRMKKYEAYDEEYDEEYDEDECLDEFEIVVAKVDDWYCMAFPDMGTASPAFITLSDFGLVASLVHDAGYWSPDTTAIAEVITEIADSGF